MNLPLIWDKITLTGFILEMRNVLFNCAEKEYGPLNFHRERIFIMDQTDLKIIELLKQNSRAQLKEIGKMVHMTGQAVAARIARLQDVGVIEGFTLRLNHEKLGKPLNAYVVVYMKSNNHAEFMDFLRESDLVVEAYRISGGGCILLKVNASGEQEFDAFLDKVLCFGNYSVSTCISRIK